jgi:hypothetical protein
MPFNYQSKINISNTNSAKLPLKNLELSVDKYTGYSSKFGSLKGLFKTPNLAE